MEDTLKQNGSKYRELLRRILMGTPQVKNITCDTENEGEIYFTVSLEDLNIDCSVFIKSQKELFSNFIVDTIGELLIRENLESFAPLLTQLNASKYCFLVSQWEHQRFGMRSSGSTLTFRFHISLLQRILTEDFKNCV